MKKFDYLVVGSGLYGAIFAHEAKAHGKSVLVVDKRPNIAGNIYTEKIEGINVHKYGAHIFHTNNKKVWNYITQFAEFNRFTNSPVANYKGELYIYYNEQEILFPPFLPLKIEELALTKGEKKMIKDMHNNPPVGKYLIQPGSFPDYREIIKSSKEELYQRILQGKEEASLCLERMNAGDWCSDYRSYENWKKDFQDYLKLLYSDLWYENGDIKED